MFRHRRILLMALTLGGLAQCLVMGRVVMAQDDQPAAPMSAPNNTAPTDPDRHGASEARGQHGAASPAWRFDLHTAKHLTGDWGGLRSDLEDAGIRVKIKAMNQVMLNVHGGKETKNGHDTAGSYEFNLYFDFDKMKVNGKPLIPGATFWIRAKGTWGGDDSDFDKEKIGAFFKTNQDASSEEPVFVDKWHWQQFLWDKRIEIRLGRQEPVKDLFDTSKIMGHEDKYFLNRALVRNATIPSKKGLSAFVKFHLTDTVYVSSAVFDAHSRNRQTNFNTAFHSPNDYRFYAEAGWDPRFQTPKGKLPGHYRTGTWYDPTRRAQFHDTLDGLRAERHRSGDWGFYVGFDQMIWKENADPSDHQGFSFAARYGAANGELNKIEHFWAVATQYQGLIPTRDEDLVGLGMAQGIFADELRRIEPSADRETVYELYYAIRLAPWLIISPDFQFITNAGGEKGDPNAFVTGIRIKMSL